jgi:predicted ATPase/DNA-binding SARP family transcriptional activator
LTLTGPGGCGKTLLALHLAGDLCASFEDVVWLVELAPLQEPGLLPDLVCHAVGLEEDGSQDDAMARLVAALRHRRFLLVLDNCEHLIQPCTSFAERLLQSCPQAYVLATSREALKSAYETIWPVPPLALPDQESRCTPEHLLGFGAIALFVQRASAVMPTFALTGENAALVAQICRRVDGLPLAIELAAASLKLLSLAQIATALEIDGSNAATGHRTAPPRQRTLEATMDWSYRLLSKEEQALFRRLCVLSGDFGLSLAAAVGDETCARTAERLLRLVEQSLVQVLPGAAEARYRLLETMKQYGRHHLQRCAEEDAVCARYADWCLQLVQAGPEQLAEDERRWLERLEAELDHVRTCLAWLYAHDQGERVLAMATMLAGFWRGRGHLHEGSRWLEAGLALQGTCIAPPVRARALDVLGVFRMWQAAYPAAQTLHEEALAIWRRVEDRRGEAMTHFRLGFLADKQDDGNAARAHLVRSLRLFSALGDAWGMDLARNRLGVVLLSQGDYPRARTYLIRSLRFLRDHQQVGGVASTLLNLGALALAQGETHQAIAVLQESLTLNQALGDNWATAYAYVQLGYAACQGNAWDEAERSFQACLRLVTGESSPDLLARLFDGTGMVAARRGETQRAARLWGAMAMLRSRHQLRARSPGEQHLYEQAVASARGHGDPGAFEAAWTEGSHQPLDDIFREIECPTVLHGPTREEPGALRIGFAQQEGPHQEGGSPRLRITSLGGVGVSRGEHLVTTTAWPYAKARELLFYLLSYPARSKEQIGLALWPDATPEHLHSSFRVILYHLRRALGDPAWILRDGQRYTFNRSLPYWYDVEAFEAAVTEAERQLVSAPDRAQARLEAAQALYRGDFLDGMPAAEWIMERQERLRRRHAEALVWLGQLYLARQDVRRARDTFLRAIVSDPYAEEAHRGVITCHVQLHEYSQAAHYYAQLRQRFECELGIAPAPQTLAALSPAHRHGGEEMAREREIDMDR